jgi:hypothetical protein
MTPTQKENVKEWLKALKSGGYKQTKGRLCINNLYCCLGVACELKGVLAPHATVQNIKGMKTEDSDFNTGLPDYHWFLETYGLDLRTTYKQKFNTFPDSPLTIQGLNDFAGLTFDQLADIIEEHVNNLESASNETTS